MRVGVIAKKLGMSVIFDENGMRIPVTLLKIPNCQVVEHRTRDAHGYTAVRVAAEDIAAHRLSKSVKGIFAKAQVPYKRRIVEFRVEEDALIPTGTELGVNHYVLKQFVDITGTSVGKGFAGVMKRHNFAGLRASHGVSISHRSHGSTGQRTQPGKVFKGTRMAGHMGNTKVTKQNLSVVLIDEASNIIGVKGSVPGHKNAFVIINDAKKKSLPLNAPYPYVATDKNIETTLT